MESNEKNKTVPWQEAIQAWIDGEVVSCDFNIIETCCDCPQACGYNRLVDGIAKIYFHHCGLLQNQPRPCSKIIKNGVWYIESNDVKEILELCYREI